VNPSQADTSAQNLITDQDKSALNGHYEEEEKLAHAPPGPAYDGLTTNVPTYLQELKGHAWPEGNEAFVNVRVCGEYLQSYARKFGVDQVTKYDTKVEKIEKSGEKWRVESTTLVTGNGGLVDNVDVSAVERIATF
jgi:cation diffusion facilitator CzcD-associated flavoprotein CzcO